MYSSVPMDTPETEGFHPTLLNVHVFCIKGSMMKTARFSFSAKGLMLLTWKTL